jgi:hypothetical protein
MGDWNAAEMPYLNSMLRAAQENRNGDVQVLLNEMVSGLGRADLSEFAVQCLNMMMDNMEYKKYCGAEIELIRKYMYVFEKYGNVDGESVSQGKKSPVIWWCWLQGLENAPELVRACYESCRQLGLEIKVITEENYTQYVTLPDFVLRKRAAGVISNAHFSDILRLELLTEYGGTWIDATVLVTGKGILKYMEDTRLFCFKHLDGGRENPMVRMGNWFISACSHDRLLTDTEAMLYAHWRAEEQAAHYFVFHFCFSIACRRNMKLWESVPSVSDVPPHIMQEEMYRAYTDKDWERLCAMSDVHKLTWKSERPQTDEKLIFDHIVGRFRRGKLSIN